MWPRMARAACLCSGRRVSTWTTGLLKEPGLVSGRGRSASKIVLDQRGAVSVIFKCGELLNWFPNQDSLPHRVVPRAQTFGCGCGLRNDVDLKTIQSHRTNITAKFCAYGNVQPECDDLLAARKGGSRCNPDAVLNPPVNADVGFVPSDVIGIAGLGAYSNSRGIRAKDLTLCLFGHWVRGSFAQNSLNLRGMYEGRGFKRS